MKVSYLTPLLCIGMLTLSGCNDPKNRLKVISKKQLSNIWTLFIRYVISKQISRIKRMEFPLTTCLKYYMPWRKKVC